MTDAAALSDMRRAADVKVHYNNRMYVLIHQV